MIGSPVDLIKAMGAAANGYSYDKVIDASANIIINGLRQAHPTLGAAEERLDQLVADIRTALRTREYNEDGARAKHLVLPPLVDLLRN